MPFLLTSSSPGDKLRATAGGKAHNLFALTDAGFPVPRWAVLGTDAFRTAIAAAGVQLSDAPLTLAERLAEAARAEQVVTASTVPAEIRADIQAALEHVGNGRVAVRSSGRHEDGAANSFAGLFDTILNVTGVEAAEEAVRRCWASAFSQRATQYRHMRGLGFGDVDLAVIVQRLVEPSSSGVMFTADPVTGSTDRIVINGVLGLGEGLVSGAVDSDALVVDKGTGSVLETSLGAQQQMVVTDGADGVLTVDVPTDRRDQCSIDTALAAVLVELGTRLEMHFGAPQDIEWAFGAADESNESKPWILQSRPITTLARETAGMGEHLGEEVSAGQLRIWDNSNIIESYAGVTSPLTFTTARTLYADVYRVYARSLNVAPAQLEQMESWLPVMLGQFNGHVYYNLLHWYRMVGIAPGYPLNRRVLEVALGVGEPLDTATAQSLRPFTFGNPATRLWHRARTTATYVQRFRRIDTLVEDFDTAFHDFIARHGLTDVSGLDGPQAQRMFRRIHDEVADIWGPLMVLDAILLTSVGLLAAMSKTFLPHAPEWFGFAVVNPGADVVSIEPARALADIAAFAHRHPDLWAFIESADPATAYLHLIEYAAEDSGPWQELHRKVADYIDRFGYRCLDELKLEAPDLRQDPSGIFHMLRMASPDEAERSGDAAQAYLDAHLRGPRRMLFDTLRAKIQRAATHRERLRFARTQGFGILKSLVAVMAGDLVRREVIENSADVFLLRRDELFGLYDGATTPADARAAINRRRTLQEGYRKLKAPARFSTTGSTYTAAELTQAGWRHAGDVARAAVGTVLTGTPSSPGVVTGRAVVVEKPEDFSSGILVAYRTDPGWVAALPFASALLIERASPLTHVAIIARELGVPTVVQIDGLTDAVRTGMTVTVDGAAGSIIVLEGEPEQARNDA
jgi:rifampicin phosphotransferase